MIAARASSSLSPPSIAWWKCVSPEGRASAIREQRATVRVEADVADGYVSEDGARRYLARRASATAAE